MAHFTSSVEYGLHCLLWLADPACAQASSRDLAELQGVSPSFVAKIFPRLEKAGIVHATEGIRGGYRLAKPADRLSLLEIIDAIEGRKPLFDCLEIRDRVAVFEGRAPAWATQGTCAIHAAINQAEEAMRQSLASVTLASIAESVERKAPAHFSSEVRDWLNGRSCGRRSGTAGRHGCGSCR